MYHAKFSTQQYESRPKRSRRWVGMSPGHDFLKKAQAGFLQHEWTLESARRCHNRECSYMCTRHATAVSGSNVLTFSKVYSHGLSAGGGI